MAAWSETYRGSVAAWECDVTEHFTIAYYFDRLAEAEGNFAELIGLGPRYRAGGFARHYDIRYARELRAGSAFHVLSGVIGQEGGLRIGHKFVDSADGATLTWFDARWAIEAAVSHPLADWDGPAAEPRPQPTSRAGFIPTARGRVQPGDLDESGRMGLAAIVHRFTDSSLQAGAAVGLTADYIKTARRAFSTFELQLSVTAVPGLGEPFVIDSGLAHLGSSSLRFVHIMSDPRSGAEWARLGQFGVQLDLDVRRPAALPAELRARAEKLVVPVA
jgi:acyl-CoA thioesterase FadM